MPDPFVCLFLHPFTEQEATILNNCTSNIHNNNILIIIIILHHRPDNTWTAISYPPAYRTLNPTS